MADCLKIFFSQINEKKSLNKKKQKKTETIIYTQIFFFL